MRIVIKPLSVNEVWKGRRFRTDKYDAYEREMLLRLRPMAIPEGKLFIRYIVGYSNSQADIDNFVKPFQDILQKKYGFNDSRIYQIYITKQIVKKGSEFIEFDIFLYYDHDDYSNLF